MADKKMFVTIVHDALGDASRIDTEMKKLGFQTSFTNNGREIVFPTSPIRLYFSEANGEARGVRDHFVDIMHKIWENLKIKNGDAAVFVGDDWR
jgi:hypothetical protein